MFETITVDDALKRGKRTVRYPIIFVFFVVFIITAFLIDAYPGQSALLIGFPGAFIIAWLYWSLSVVKWKLWAFEHVRNVHELKQRAIVEQLMWNDKSFFSKTEIWTSIQREKWQSLQYKFDVPDLFEDDYTIPEETQIRYSKPQKLFLAVLMVIIAFVGFFLLTTDGDKTIAIIVAAIGTIMTIVALKQYFDRRPRITISNEGITTANKGFFSWKDISGEYIKRQQQGKRVIFYLIFNHSGGLLKTDLSGLDTNHTKVDKLLRLYRGRYQGKANIAVNNHTNV